VNSPVRELARHGRINEESGAVAIIVALFLVVLLVLGALVVDLGSLYDHDRELQSAADAGALAGAQQIIVNSHPDTVWESPAELAEDYVGANAAPTNSQASIQWGNLAPWEADVDVVEGSVTVDLRENGVEFFARVIGR
jgi:Flp pilus assembly protein TadG